MYNAGFYALATSPGLRTSVLNSTPLRMINIWDLTRWAESMTPGPPRIEPADRPALDLDFPQLVVLCPPSK